GGGPVRLRCPVEVRGRGTGLRLSGVRAYGAGGYAGPAGPLGAAGPDLRGDPGSGPARPGWRAPDGGWNRPRRMARGPRRRVLDSTPLYDAVATMDTVTLVRSAIRGLLKAADGELAGELRAVLRRDDDYMAAGKPVCDYGDAAAREALVDALAKDARG